ncbi:MAG: hypothetical protein RLZZ436_3715 [Planctomycetota bacterium]|jgi:protein SCO1/2
MSIASRFFEISCTILAIGAGLAVSSFCGSTSLRNPSSVGENISIDAAVSQTRRPAATELPDSVSQTLDSAQIPAFSGPRQTDLFPEVPLVDHTGTERFFRSELAAGKVLCFAMFYTRCKGTCPGTVTKMLRLRRSLTQEFGRENLHFVCLTLDPLHDQADVLERYADTLGVNNDPELAPIYFCTGLPENVDAVRRSLGMYDPDPVVDADISQHAAKFVLGNDRLNRWTGMPAALPFEDLHETALRIAGNSDRQRFSARLAIDGRTRP